MFSRTCGKLFDACGVPDDFTGMRKAPILVVVSFVLSYFYRDEEGTDLGCGELFEACGVPDDFTGMRKAPILIVVSYFCWDGEGGGFGCGEFGISFEL